MPQATPAPEVSRLFDKVSTFARARANVSLPMGSRRCPWPASSSTVPESRPGSNVRYAVGPAVKPSGRATPTPRQRPCLSVAPANYPPPSFMRHDNARQTSCRQTELAVPPTASSARRQTSGQSSPAPRSPAPAVVSSVCCSPEMTIPAPIAAPSSDIRAQPPPSSVARRTVEEARGKRKVEG